ncbi:MAG: hypothetical protein V2A67_05420 [Bacteroidota bacterium]
MKKLILSFLLIIPISCLFAQQYIPRKYSRLMPETEKDATSADLPGTIRWYAWDQERWSADKTVTVTYNSSGNPLTSLHDLMTGTDVRYTFTYDENGRLIQELTQLKQDGLWVPSGRISWQFDERGNEILWTVENYISGVWMIQNGVMTDLEYQDDLVYRETWSFFDSSNGSYYLFWRFTYSYDNAVRTGYINEVFRDEAWVNYFRAFLFYDEENRPDYDLFDSWDSIAGGWAADEMERFFYSGELNETLILYQYFPETSLYMPTERYIYEYDDHRNQTLATSEAWQNGDWSITNGNRYTMTYDALHAITRITETWIAANDAIAAHWEYSTKEEFSDFQSSVVEGLAAPKIEFKCFPNPADEFIWITIGNGEPVDGFLELNDLTGKTLLRSLYCSSIGTIRINLNGIPQGLYKLVFRNQVQQPVAVSVIVH